jgi:hypothetical protein
MDMLPREVTAPVADSLVRSLDVPELRRAFASACELLLVEIDAVDAPLAARLSAPIRELATNPAV